MTQKSYCYENVMTERVNAILRDVFFLNQTFSDVAHAKRATKNEINL